MLKKNLWFLIFFSFFYLAADEGSANSNESAESDQEEVISITEEREETLLYGIDSEIISLLETLKNEDNQEFAEFVVPIIENTKRGDVIYAIYDYFDGIEFYESRETALQSLLNYDELTDKLIIRLIQYLGDYDHPDYGDLLFDLTTHEKTIIAQTAIKGIGEIGDRRFDDDLLDLYDDPDTGSAVKSMLIKTYGELQIESARDKVISILRDEDEESSLRWNAAAALGAYGTQADYDVLTQYLADGDPNLRSFVLEAILQFEDIDIAPVLIDALRDSYWKVRVTASRILGERQEERAIAILEYKVRKDPENRVKQEALRALGDIGTDETFDFLVSQFVSDKTEISLRYICLDKMVSQDANRALDSINTVVDQEWEKEESPLLEYIATVIGRNEITQGEDLYLRMLDHDKLVVKIGGIRGVGLNRFSAGEERLRSMYENPKVSNSVKRHVKDALDRLEGEGES